MNPQPTSRKKYVWLAVIVVIIAGALIAYFATRDNQPKDSTANNAGKSTPVANAPASFAPAVTTNQPFEAKITSSGATSTQATMDYDGQGSVSYAAQQDGQTSKFIFTNKAYYVCTGSQCLKYPASQSASSSFNPNTYQYDASKINALKNGVAYKGQQACPSGNGTCQVWSGSSRGTTSTVYINAANYRIDRVTAKTDNITTTVTYQYKKITITPPANATAAPSI